MLHFWIRYPMLWCLMVQCYGILHGTVGQFLASNGLTVGKRTSPTPTLPSDESDEVLEPTPPAPAMPCQVRTIVTQNSNASYLIPDRVYDISTLDQMTNIDLPSVLQPIKDYQCISVRILSQLQPNTTDIVEGTLEIFCGLKLLIRFTFWIEQRTGCTDLFVENVRVDLERCGTIQRTVPTTFYTILIQTSSEIVFQLGYDISPTLKESVPLPNYDHTISNKPSIESMWKCNCTIPREAFKSLRMCIVGSVNNITKLVIHISLIVSIGIATTCTLILVVWIMRRIWKIVEKL
uniref:Uncharacterized protein n=1 Tax=Anopheles christyi TaxID=43041 RepID=A0A182K867_9DIPT